MNTYQIIHAVADAFVVLTVTFYLNTKVSAVDSSVNRRIDNLEKVIQQQNAHIQYIYNMINGVPTDKKKLANKKKMDDEEDDQMASEMGLKPTAAQEDPYNDISEELKELGF
jgi:hypothetical protein